MYIRRKNSFVRRKQLFLMLLWATGLVLLSLRVLNQFQYLKGCFVIQNSIMIRSSFFLRLCLLLTLPTTNNLLAQDQILFGPGIDGTTQNTCNGFIIDSGGQGGSGYGNNENVTVTICPDTPGETISIDFNTFNLDTYDPNPAPGLQLADRMIIYDGDNTGANTLGTYFANQLLGVTAVATNLNATGCLTIQFISNDQNNAPGSFTASVACQTPCSPPVAGGVIVGGITPDSIRVCVGEVVDFQELGSFAQTGFTIVDYMWDFQDGTTANGQNVSHAYSLPGQYRVQLTVTDDNDDNVCTNTNLIDLEVLVSTFPTFETFPGDTSLCLGESLTLTIDPNQSEQEWTGFPGSQSVDDGCITDNELGVSQEVSLTQTGFTAGATITDVNDIQSVCLNMEHSFMGDLVVAIICPNGQSVVMHQQGGGGTNLGEAVQADGVDCDDPSTQGVGYDYCFTNTATQTWVEASVGVNILPAGDYSPVNSLAGLVGCPANGIWTLSVTDNWAADDGTVFSFGLTLDPSYYPDITSFTPDIGFSSDSSFWHNTGQFIDNISGDGNTVTINPTVEGSYDYTYEMTNDFGCSFDSTITVTINPNAVPFPGNDTTICLNDALQLDALINGQGVGTNCNYILNLDDTFGDGWNGNTISVTIGGVTNSHTINTGNNNQINLTIPNGQTATLTFNGEGNFVGECEYQVLDEDGVVVVNQDNPTAGTTDVVTANCAPDYVYEWTPPTPNLSATDIANPLFTANSTETLNLTIYPVGHPLCATSESITITAQPLPEAGEDAVIEVCTNGSPVNLFNSIGGAPMTTGTWEDPNGNVVTMPFDPLTMPFGDYTYIVGDDACVEEAVVTVNQKSVQIISIVTTDVTCFDFSDGSALIEGVNIDMYSLNGAPDVNVSSPTSSFTIEDLAAGNYGLTVRSIDGCAFDTNFIIIQPDPLTLTIQTVDAACFGFNDGSATATVTGGILPYTYNWVAGINGDQNGQVDSLLAGNYFLEVVDDRSCVIDQAFIIDQPDNVVPVIIPDTLSGCREHQVDFVNATNSNQIATTFFDFGDGNTQQANGLNPVENTYDFAGIYDLNVTMTTNVGCVYTVEYTDLIEVFEIPVANFLISPNPASMFNPFVNLLNTSTDNADQFQWMINGGNPAASNDENVNQVLYPQEIAQYPVKLEVTTEDGCIDSISKIVHVVNEVYAFAPNAFTPNGDEFNNYWRVYVNGIDLEAFNLKIFNRWGELIWESSDQEVGWDGTYNGVVCQDGTYTWKVECSDQVNDDRYEFQGFVNILR